MKSNPLFSHLYWGRAATLLILALLMTLAGCNLPPAPSPTAPPEATPPAGADAAIPSEPPAQPPSALPPTPALVFSSPTGPAPRPTQAEIAPAIETPEAAEVLPATPAPGSQNARQASDGMIQLFVPEGAFPMGSATGEHDEAPVHEVWLDAFWIDQTEVTIAQYTRCIQSGACQPDDCQNANEPNSTRPATCVDWLQAADYCRWVGRRLPSEAEWEKAARGSDGRTYPWGEGIDLAHAHYDEGYDTTDTKPVGSYVAGASPYGALDMAGNADEWVADWYNPDYYTTQSEWRNPTGPASGEMRVLRGGSFDRTANEVRATYRSWFAPEDSEWDIGFRCAQSAP